MIKYEELFYCDGHEREYNAVRITWAEVEKVLGHKHSGYSDDDDALVAALLDADAPKWVREASGWIDEVGWGLIGPEAVSVINPHSGISVRISLDEVTVDKLEALAVLMDDEIREELHMQLAPCSSGEFWAAYVREVGPEKAGAIWFS